MSDQPRRLDERHKSHRSDQSRLIGQPHRLDQKHQPDLPPEYRDQPIRSDFPLEQRRQLDQQVSPAPQLDQPRKLTSRNQPHRIDPPHGQKKQQSDSGHTSSPGESASANDQESPDSAAEPPKVCYTCAKSFPATQFRFRNKATGVRMTECRSCYNLRTKNWHRKKRAREKGWDIHKTASQIARSPDISRTVALLEQLVDVMGGPENLVEQWREECWRLIKQKRSSTRLARMYEMLIVLMQQTRRA